ncbi:PEBP family protein [Candidatus Villigracilis vicinus]|uniref:PEBP family protein n=1 Tax=Candidatus Villigracilis vicinus TaxID=3140679 RepID=UPI0031EC4781
MNSKLLLSLSLIVLSALTACQPPAPITESAPVSTAPQEQPQVQPTDIAASTAEVQVKAEVWADNWFAFYLADQLIKEDSVPITTERSFNSETFTFTASYPMTLNFIAKDFKQDDTGLEYIGSNRQQMGDGGLIAQFTNAQTGELIAVTNVDWVCTVIHEAPLDKSCERERNPVAGSMPCGFTSLEEPAGWMTAAFDSSSWDHASIYSAAEVSPKDGYEQISWDSSAQFIWGPDLETDNTILCKLTVTQ